MKKPMKAEPAGLWSGDYPKAYETSNYGPGLAGTVMRTSHALVEKPFGPEIRFDTVLEVGAGSGVHLEHIRHAFDRYLLTDASTDMIEEMKNASNDPRIDIAAENAGALSCPDNHVDRLIACHVLEHIPEPHKILEEWYRVIKPGGVLSIVLPCDPGLLWRIGRNFGPRATAKKNGLDYDYVMAREHVNPINNLVALIQYHFDDIDEIWWPSRIPIGDVNLIYAVNISL